MYILTYNTISYVCRGEGLPVDIICRGPLVARQRISTADDRWTGEESRERKF